MKQAKKTHKRPIAKTKVPADNQGWDQYWEKDAEGEQKRGLYNLIAEFYRKFIIRPNLNRFVKKHFHPSAKLLHAGCGSGQVDRDIRHIVKITGLDISPNALKIFARENRAFCTSCHGSIFAVPAKNASFDGIYNLGVMEHFDENDIQKILLEFKRILKPSGKLLIFWPPEFGASVIFFKILKILLRPFYGQNVKFHPDEICRIRSKKHALDIFERAGFRVEDYYFGPRDAFTYSIIVAEKRKI